MSQEQLTSNQHIDHESVARWLEGLHDFARPIDQPYLARAADIVRASLHVLATRAAEPPASTLPKEPSPEWILNARAEGRAEFLSLLLDQHPESFYSDYTGTHSLGESGDHDEHWKLDKLRELFKVDDATWSLLDNACSSYWMQQSRIDELERAAVPPTGRQADRLAAIDKLEELGSAGLIVSICYGPTPQGVRYSVDCMHQGESFSRPFGARDFGHCLEIVELEAKQRGWLK